MLKETLIFSNSGGSVLGSNFISLKLYSTSRKDHEDNFIKHKDNRIQVTYFKVFFLFGTEHS